MSYVVHMMSYILWLCYHTYNGSMHLFELQFFLGNMPRSWTAGQLIYFQHNSLTPPSQHSLKQELKFLYLTQSGFFRRHIKLHYLQNLILLRLKCYTEKQIQVPNRHSINVYHHIKFYSVEPHISHANVNNMWTQDNLAHFHEHL